MTIAIPANLIRASHDFSGGQIFTFVQRSSKWMHVWTWDQVNGLLSLSQFRRGKYVVKVNHWHSPNGMSNMIDARRMLRKDSPEPQWFGKTSVQYLQRAFSN